MAKVQKMVLQPLIIKQIMKWSQYILYGIFLLAIITDGEISVIGWLAELWRWAVLDRLVFFHVNFDGDNIQIIEGRL